MCRQHRHAQLRQRRLGDGNQHDVERRRRQAGAHQDARDGDKDQRQELLHGGLREYVERNPADYRVQHLGNVAGAGGDHEAEAEGDAGGIDDADHDADGGAGGADGQRVSNADMETVEQLFHTVALALVHETEDQQSAKNAAHDGREGVDRHAPQDVGHQGGRKDHRHGLLE